MSGEIVEKDIKPPGNWRTRDRLEGMVTHHSMGGRSFLSYSYSTNKKELVPGDKNYRLLDREGTER